MPPIDYNAMAQLLMGQGSPASPASGGPDDMASIIAQIQQMQVQNGLRNVSPLGQGYYPMDNSPAPPGYRMNENQGGGLLGKLAAKNPYPPNPTEGGFMGRAMGAVRGGNPGAKTNSIAKAAEQARGFASEVGLQKGIEFAAKRWGVDPAAIRDFLIKNR
jgi:hypothetical protein